MQEEKQPQKPSTPPAKPETPQTTQKESKETIPEPDRTVITTVKDIFGHELKQSNK